MKEIWKPIAEYKGYYEVSNLGRVRGLDRSVKHITGRTNRLKGKVLIPNRNKLGYKYQQLHKNASSKLIGIHRLVCIAFLDNPKNHPLVNHKDSNPSNNHLDNLEWSTFSGNTLHSLKKGRWRGKISGEKATEIHTMYAKGVDTKEIAKIFNITTNTVSRIGTGRRHSYLGLKKIFRQPYKKKKQ